MVYPDFFSLRIDDPELIDASARVDPTFLILSSPKATKLKQHEKYSLPS
jgi:hypothetical protein